MFGFGKKNREPSQTAEKENSTHSIYAVQSGKVCEIASLPDVVFAKKIIGDGYAIKPYSGEAFSPVSGTVIDVQENKHAYGILSDDGVEILVHIGINTVSLKGKGFKSAVRKGQRIKKGELLAEFDIKLLKNNKLPTEVIVLITSMDKIENLKINYADATAKESAVMTYELKEKK